MAGPNPNQKLVVVFESDNPIAFDIAKSALEDAEIQFVVPDEGRIGFGVTPILDPVYRIAVLQSRAAEAREVMTGLIRKRDSEPEE